MTSAEPNPIRVLLVEDHDMVAEALQLALDRADGITVVGRARSRAEAVADAGEHEPDVVLLDRRLADGDALGILAELGETGARVLVLTGDATPSVAVQVAKAGGAGLLLKSSQLGVLESAVRDVAAGGVVFDPELLPEIFDRLTGRAPARGAELTARERETLDLLAEGATTEEIGERLGVSRNTTRNHVQRVLEKLGARSKLEAVAVARREGLIG
ncbi:DNA-binding response regulator, NarL/FixJ family, contains REC and HTH domains [Amycolatopsis pretoriensis]|uniref:DNA-binding response regulator, NarL/FixJ family, contains REC and HTH domains n=1 Tax=Amycolatopsis pretoriensis TaxID=218821 RepID=A0A1H5QB65_9PSEU|nr:response regulator transcription factor [Amycolatopsis pretoriensis]SEF23114.1 DNA-binding response regulator, NarL/FixJ family, contains REC and HTH domains [Amycolatopsis pretoriensis]